MGVFRIVLSAVRGLGTLGVVAVDRIAVDAPPRSAVPRSAVASREDGLHAFYPSQSESAALLDTYLIRARERSSSARFPYREA